MKQKIEDLRALKYSRKIGLALMLLCPLFIVFITEINQRGDFSGLVMLVTQKPFVLLFDFLFMSVLFYFVTMISKKAFIGGAVVGIVGYAMSCTEFYRYRASSSHFTLGDFSLFTNIDDAMKFAGIKIYPMVVIMLVSLVLYVVAMYLFDVRIDVKWKHTIPTCATMVAGMAAFFMVPNISNPVFDTFGVNRAGSSNNFILEEKFADNGMIAFFIENTTDMINTINIKPPENYSAQSIETMAVEIKNVKPQIKPNVIMLMSESYTDFRIKNNFLNVSDDYYTNVDKMAGEGYTGKAVVPTFGGYTVKSEFELLFGLPIKSLNGTQAPQSLIGENEQTTIASYYKKLDYTTSYMHPYTREFYDRGELFSRYSFDHMYFQEEIPGTDFRKYRDDGVVFDKAMEQIKTDEKPSYIHITSMQNHLPYNENVTQTEFDYYMDGVKNTDKRIGELMEELKNVNEPTVIMMVGDHFPFFTEENSAYDKLGVTSENCKELYEQPYYIWANYDLDYTTMPKETVSLFYLPHILLDAVGLPENEITGLMKEEMKTMPIYTMEYNEDAVDEKLNTITYDLILGDNYTSEKMK